MRRIIDHIFRIVERVDVEIDFDPLFVISAHSLDLSPDPDQSAAPNVRSGARSRASGEPIEAACQKRLLLYRSPVTSHKSRFFETLGWWNGRHVRLRGVCRKACGFKS